MNILKAVNLRKIYGQGETEVKALDGVNLEVEKGGVCSDCWNFWKWKVYIASYHWWFG